MNVTASKVLLGVSLAAYGYVAYDHLSADETKKPAASTGKEITAGLVNRTVVLHLEQDPFNSVPLSSGSVHDAANAAATGASGVAGAAGEEGKTVGEVKLDGVMITVANRVAVVNGRAMREGDTMVSPGGATIRAVRIGVGYCIIDGAGRRMMLRVDDPQVGSKSATAVKPGESKPDAPNQSAQAQQHKPAAQSWIDEHQNAQAQMKDQIEDAQLPPALKQMMTQLFENDK